MFAELTTKFNVLNVAKRRVHDRIKKSIFKKLNNAFISQFKGKPGEPPKMKDEKELKPVSMRVRDAAEALLMLILEQVIYL